MMIHRIMYLRDKRGAPVGCVAIKLHRHVEYDRQLVEYQVSVLNPLDRFNRATARHLALGRMMEAPLTVRVHHEPSMFEVTLEVMRDIATDSVQPTRARQSAKRWLQNNTRQTLESDY
jgi:hypothetical protein